MQKYLRRKILCSILAAGICGSTNFVMAANSGGEDIIIDDLPTYAGNNGTGSNNEVYFDYNGDKTNIYVIGGYAASGEASSNSVTVNGTTVNYVYGGKTGSSGAANNNSVVISGSTVVNVYGGYVPKNGTANNNSVVISDSTVRNHVYGSYVLGSGAANNNSNNNSVVVSGSTVDSYLYGSYVYGGTANNNSVVISDSTVSYVYGSNVGNSGTANNNSVVISGSTVNGYVYGSNVGSSGITNNNSVVISDSTVGKNVYGGYAGKSGTANNNSVTIAGSSDLTVASLYGRDNNATGTGNKLILIDFKGKDGTDTSVKSLNNFDSIEVKALGDDKEYTAGDKLTLLTATGDNGKYINNCEVGESTQYALLGTDRVAVEVKGNAAIEGDNNEKVTFTVEGMQASRQSAITTEARAGVTAFVNQGAEVVADNLNMLSQSAEGLNTFATVSGNNSKYDTGSYADINGWNSIIGIANTKEIGSDKLNYGTFFENGSGNYNTYNEIGGAGFRGDGSVLYNGGGVMVRLDKENGFYTEAAVRAGSVKNELNNGLADAWGNNYGYETENAYYGGHIGIGKIFKLDNGKAWDVYGKYFHMHHEGDSVEIAGDTFDFDSVDSNKLRIGARFSEQQGEKLTSYYGLAWDYEFSGDVKGTAAGYDMHTPSLEGSTVIGEIGFRYTPGKESPWYFDANVKGYVGMQEGLSGSVQAVYSF